MYRSTDLKMKAAIINKSKLKTTEEFIGESLEEKIRRVMSTGEPVEAVSPMYYTERKDGVKPETDIRTDRWEIAQKAMTTINEGIREKRKERMSAVADKPEAKPSESKMNV